MSIRNEGTILVTGASGKIGRELVRRLQARGARLRAFAHRPDKGRELESRGIEVAYGDLGEPGSVEAALSGAAAFFLLSPIHPRMAEREKAAIQAAREAGLGRIVLLSGRGASLDSRSSIIRMHAQSEVLVRDSGLEWTILRPEYFMQNFLGYAPGIRANGRFEACFADRPASTVDCRDIAELAAIALTEEGHAGKSYDLSGPEALSLREAAKKLEARLGKPVGCVEISPEQMRARMEAMGMPRWLVDEMSSGEGMSECPPPSPAAAEVTGRAPLSFDNFIEEHRAAF